jgi:hypothetical protein
MKLLRHLDTWRGINGLADNLSFTCAICAFYPLAGSAVHDQEKEGMHLSRAIAVHHGLVVFQGRVSVSFDILGRLFLCVVMSRVFMFGFKLVVLAPPLRCHFLFFDLLV